MQASEYRPKIILHTKFNFNRTMEKYLKPWSKVRKEGVGIYGRGEIYDKNTTITNTIPK